MSSEDKEQQSPPSQNEEEQKPYGLAGIRNFGNTCYANTVIQALRVIPEWSNIINNAPMPEAPTEACQKVFAAYKDIAMTMWCKETVMGSVCRPELFWETVHDAVRDTVYEQFAINIPHDAHEFLNYITDQCHETLKQAVPDSHPDRALYKSLNYFTSPIIDTMFGWEKIECICTSCSHTSISFDAFNVLKVGLNKLETKTINELLEEERKDETIEDYTCDNCKKKTMMNMRRSIWRLPETICVMFKRFNYDMTSGRMSKDNSPFNYDGTAIGFSEHFSHESQHESKSYTYKPIALIDHFGHMAGGHYVAQIYHPLMHKWFLFDDERGTPLDGPKFGPSNYIMVLRRQGESHE